MVEPPAGGPGDRGLGAERDPDPGGGQHRQVVGAVADGDRLGRRHAKLRRQRQQRHAFAVAGHDRPPHRAGDPPLDAVEMIGDDAIKAEGRRDRLGKDPKPARDQRRRRTRPAHRRNQRPRPRGQPDPLGRLFEEAPVHSLEECDASLERRGEIDLAIHRAPRDLGNPRTQTERLGDLVEHLVFDDCRFEIGDEEPLAPSRNRLNEDVNRRAADYRARHLLGWYRLVVVENKIASLFRCEPQRLAPKPQSLGDGGGETGQVRAAAGAGDQGDNETHEPGSYSRSRARHKPPVLIIAGPTASGKSALALELAATFGGTVINADSMQIYRDLSILTARPDAAAEERTPHRLYGFLDAAERGSAAQWRALALDEIADATRAGRLPILVGGTGLYLRALEKGLAPVPDIPEPIRREAIELYRRLGGVAFRERLAELEPEGARRLSPGDRQRLMRAWEVVRATGTALGTWQQAPHPLSPYRFRMILLTRPREELYAACETRFVRMIEAGGLAEAAALAARGLDPDLPAMKALGVPELMAHLRGEMPLTAAVAAAQRATRQYAKRQMTWFRHQTIPDLRLDAPFSQDLLQGSADFVRASLLTG
jgi:tRNA dimethylallyltransferase